MSASGKNTGLDALGEKVLDRNDVARELAENLREDFENNSKYNTGAEVEDLVLRAEDEYFEPLNNQEAEELLQNIHESSDLNTELETESMDGREVVKSVKVKQSPFPFLDEEEPFYAEIDNDLGPRQSEVATPIIDNPADLTFWLENLRRERDKQVENHDVFAAGLSPEFMFEDVKGEDSLDKYLHDNIEEVDRRPGERYDALHKNHGAQFNAMKYPASTQLNSGLPVGEGMTLDELVFWLENGGSEPSLSDVTQAESAVFDADMIAKKNDQGEYESVLESGREMIYDLFIANSDAADREDVEERWGDELGKALPSNNNYGLLETTNDAWSVEDVVEATMSTPGIMSADISPSDVHVEETGETVEQHVDSDEIWVVFDNNRMDKNLGEALEDGEYAAKFLKDGELVDVKVKHDLVDDHDIHSFDEESMNFNDYMDLAKDYVTTQSTFVRPDIALKMDGNGIAEGRNYSNSPRTTQAILDQKGLLMKMPDIQEQYAELSGEEAKDFREEVNRKGLDAEFSDGSLRDLQAENVDIKAEGLKDSFPEDRLPYTFEVLAEEYESLDTTGTTGFREFLDDKFSDADEFIDYQIEKYNEGPGKQGKLDVEDWSQQYDDFQDWFVETAYVDPMNQYLGEATVNQQLVEEANCVKPEEAYKQLRR